MATATEPVVRLVGSTIAEQRQPNVVAGVVTEAVRGVVRDGSLSARGWRGCAEGV